MNWTKIFGIMPTFITITVLTNLVLGLIIFCVGVGCNAKRNYNNINHGSRADIIVQCTCLKERPQDYCVVLEFTTHDGNTHKIEKIVEWNSTMGEYEFGNLPSSYTIGYGYVPTMVYEVRLTDPENIEYYYTWSVPSKNDKEFYEINDIITNQTTMVLDDDSIRLKELPLKLLPLDYLSKRNKEYGEKYRAARWNCPIHDGFMH